VLTLEPLSTECRCVHCTSLGFEYFCEHKNDDELELFAFDLCGLMFATGYVLLQT